jgi:hypothetical protein
MILHWQQMELYYGNHLREHRPKFEQATQTTYGILCTRFSPEDSRVAASAGAHAEEQLINNQSWRTDLPLALEHWDARDRPMVTTLAINRSPCTNCTELLVSALLGYHQRYPLRTQLNRFILASRGAYEDSAMETRTTQNGLVRLHAAGWELCVLQTGSVLPRRGEILIEGIERIAGSGHVRLSS